MGIRPTLSVPTAWDRGEMTAGTSGQALRRNQRNSVSLVLRVSKA